MFWECPSGNQGIAVARSELSEEEVLEQVERLISSQSSGLDVVLRDEDEVETKNVAELTEVLLIRTRHVTKT